MNKYTIKIGELSDINVMFAGGKGRCLDLMIKDNFPIPNGYIVLSKAFSDFVKFNNIELNLPPATIHQKIIGGIVPKPIVEEILAQYINLGKKYVAVRSSALVEDSKTASWAGELETYLNTTQINLEENIKKCWASFFSQRATVYRQNKGIDNPETGVAVVVQEMVQSDVSGTCFTRHPVTKSLNTMYIEAIYGLGEMLVSGSLSPDMYIVDKKEWKISEISIENQEQKMVRDVDGKTIIEVPKEIRSQQKLTDGQILELAKICGRIEELFEVPQDIEWAMEDNKIYIVQSRPITA